MRKLEIGSGNRPTEGYEHLDINPDCPCVEYVTPMDKIPVDDNIFDKIKAIHVIEHQPWKNTLDTLKEWVRILKPGGTLQIATPNLRWIAQSYIDATQGNASEILKDTDVMHSEEIKYLTLVGNIDYGLWANFKIMSSGGTWDQHFACFDARILSMFLIKAGCSETYVDHDGDSLVIRGIK